MIRKKINLDFPSVDKFLITRSELFDRLPEESETGSSIVLVGGFRHPGDASQVLAALEQSEFKGQLQRH